MVGLRKYATASTLACAAVVYHAYYSREQFYPAMLYLATSKTSFLVLGNFALVLTILFGQLLKNIFLGQLREAEIERLYELSRHEIMETCLAMTIFRDEFTVSFAAMFTALLLIKVFHWLTQKRVEYIETTPSVSTLSHVRIITFLALLLAVDMVFLQHAVSHTLKQGPSVLLLFAFEYVILASSVVATFLKYGFYTIDVVMEGQWDNKAVYVFYLELVRDLLHLAVYLVFFLIIFLYYGLPLHLVRDLYETFRNFKARVADFIRYRRITSNMNDRFVDATQEELNGGDATCIICREEMAAAKKLPCGHLFHIHCLRSWLERQQTCPTCRAAVIAPEQSQTTHRSARQGLDHGQGQQPPLQGGLEGPTRQQEASYGAASQGASGQGDASPPEQWHAVDPMSGQDPLLYYQHLPLHGYYPAWLSPWYGAQFPGASGFVPGGQAGPIPYDLAGTFSSQLPQSASSTSQELPAVNAILAEGLLTAQARLNAWHNAYMTYAAGRLDHLQSSFLTSGPLASPFVTDLRRRGGEEAERHAEGVPARSSMSPLIQVLEAQQTQLRQQLELLESQLRALQPNLTSRDERHEPLQEERSGELRGGVVSSGGTPAVEGNTPQETLHQSAIATVSSQVGPTRERPVQARLLEPDSVGHEDGTTRSVLNEDTNQ